LEYVSGEEKHGKVVPCHVHQDLFWKIEGKSLLQVLLSRLEAVGVDGM
jgi:hypothetical protein